MISYIHNMKTLSMLCLFLILAKVKSELKEEYGDITVNLADGSFEKSFVWIVDKTTRKHKN